MLPEDVAHEVGHLLLLSDDYGLFAFGHHKGHMMSNSVNRHVVQHEVSRIITNPAQDESDEDLGSVCGCNK